MKAKIVGGDFGTKGKVAITGKTLAISGMKKASYTLDRIERVSTSERKERHFSALSALVGAILLGAILGMFFSFIGAVVGIAIGLIGSFYSTTETVADIHLPENLTVSVSASNRFVKKLYQAQPA